MEVDREPEPPLPPPSAAELAAFLEHATLMAKQLPYAADPSQHHQIHAALQSAHHRLSLFLSHHHPPPLPENSISSAVGGGEEDGDPMEDEEEVEQSSRAVEKVAWRMRECFIQNKRPKRQLSPSAAEQQRSFDDEGERVGAAAAAEFDPFRTKLRSLDLVYQFHA